MDRIWAPWRSAYLTTISDPKDGECLFCRIGSQPEDGTDHVFLRREHCYAVLNRYPYNNGHALIVPYAHLSDPGQFNDDQRREFFGLIDEVKSLLDEILHPDAYNIGMNIGHAAGAGIPDHIHMHIVPRWSGDGNFMPAIAGTKVISQSLDELHQALQQADRDRRAA